MLMKYMIEIKYNKFLEMLIGGKQWIEEGFEQGSFGFYSKFGNLIIWLCDYFVFVRYYFFVFFFLEY